MPPKTKGTSGKLFKTSSDLLDGFNEKYKGNAEYLKGTKNFLGGKKLEELPGDRFTKWWKTGGENSGKPPMHQIKGVVALLKLAGESNLQVEDATKNATLQTLIKSVNATTLTVQQLQERGNEGTLTSTDLVTHCEEKYKVSDGYFTGIESFLGGKKLEELPGDWFTQWSKTGGENVTVYPPKKVPKKVQQNDNNSVFAALQKIGAHQEEDGKYKIIVKDNTIHLAYGKTATSRRYIR